MQVTRVLLVALSLGVVAACSDGGGAQEQDGGDSERAAQTATTLDDSPFCKAIRSLGELSSAPAEGDGSAEEVMRQSEALVTLVDDAAATAPDDAPDEVLVLFDDYRALGDAIAAASGDTTAAFEALGAASPAVADRLSRADAYERAFTFFTTRCGTGAP